MKNYIITIFVYQVLIGASGGFACTEIFVECFGYHFQARTMDFKENIGYEEVRRSRGQNGVTDNLVSEKPIPSRKILSWKVKYPYVAKTAYTSGSVVDGMNVQGFSVAVLSLPGSINPKYDPSNSKPAIGVYSVAEYLLSQAQDTSEAISLLQNIQIVESKVETTSGVFVENIPIQIIFSDAIHRYALEFKEKKFIVKPIKWNVVTNLSVDSDLLDKISVAQTDIPQDDYRPSTRFLIANKQLADMPDVTSLGDALRLVETIISSVLVPQIGNATEPTLWWTIKVPCIGIYFSRFVGRMSENGKLEKYDSSEPQIIYLNSFLENVDL